MVFPCWLSDEKLNEFADGRRSTQVYDTLVSLLLFQSLLVLESGHL